jgi:hypothetical protein
MFYIPFVRTLKARSERVFTRVSHHVQVDELGVEHSVDVEEEVPQENSLNYTPIGNYKWYVFVLCQPYAC